jgi:prophage antirepressor-like protein
VDHGQGGALHPAGRDVVPFDLDGASVRVVMRDGEPWFVLSDVCRALDLGNPSRVASRLDDDEKCTLTLGEGGSADALHTSPDYAPELVDMAQVADGP